ncbi:MAG TPA: DUF305 domain-containing protein [Herpetosiphonaceae bacterium]|nr:DUF305 domain-containing protein [Herpetosiphonaceae bacterium]
MTQQQAVGAPERVSGARDWRQYAHWIPALLAAVLAAAALVLLVSIRAPAEGSPEVRFARDMAAHHDQAVEMAIFLRDRTADPDLRIFALDIMLTQQTQIGQMQGWLAAWGRSQAGREPPMAGHGEHMGMATAAQVAELGTLPVAEAEVAFLRLMIRHHEGGIAMARDAIEETRRSEVVRLASSIVSGQESEIAFMRELLGRRGVQ